MVAQRAFAANSNGGKIVAARKDLYGWQYSTGFGLAAEERR
jgi:hypothetical protein